MWMFRKITHYELNSLEDYPGYISEQQQWEEEKNTEIWTRSAIIYQLNHNSDTLVDGRWEKKKKTGGMVWMERLGIGRQDVAFFSQDPNERPCRIIEKLQRALTQPEKRQACWEEWAEDNVMRHSQAEENRATSHFQCYSYKWKLSQLVKSQGLVLSYILKCCSQSEAWEKCQTCIRLNSNSQVVCREICFYM